MTVLKAVLFDHDGTLVDSEAVHFQLWEKVLERYGVSLTAEEYDFHYSGIPTQTNARKIVSRYKLRVSYGTLAEEKNNATTKHLSQNPFPLMPAAKEMIIDLYEAGVKLAVVTGAGRSGVDSTMHAYGLAHYFSEIVSGDDVRESKPAPDCYSLALERLGTTAAGVIAIEDTEHGIQAAVTAGIRCCGVRNSMSGTHDFSLALKSFPNLADTWRWISQSYTMPQNKFNG